MLQAQAMEGDPVTHLLGEIDIFGTGWAGRGWIPSPSGESTRRGRSWTRRALDLADRRHLGRRETRD